MKGRYRGWLVGCVAVLALAGCGSADGPSGEPAASGLAVLAQGAQGFEHARPDAVLAFPRDHGAHPDFRIEWWYLTANLEDAGGQLYGAQWTLFRYAVRPPAEQPRAEAEPGTAWQSGQVYMAHLALTTPTGHVAFQRYARGGEHGSVRQAGATAEPFAAWLDDWRLASTGEDWLPLELRAQQGDFALRLRLDSDRPLVLQGEGGFSQKHPAGGGSHYYSQPFLQARGELVVDGAPIPVTGQAWLDREWSSQFLQPGQAGWDWFALHLDSGEKLMLFRLRQRAEAGHAADPYLHGALIAPDGTKRTLDPAGLSFRVLEETAVAGRRLPLRWRIDLPEIDRSLTVEALHPDQWLDLDYPYWEGVVTVTGDGPGSRGVGYLELTGYPEEM
ncbi:MAG: lipocalin-like domain-containing protein [Xanthomonadales bacterium]|nr:lipocalin-like domain-containing protein [Xanthomonadales bacterium]